MISLKVSVIFLNIRQQKDNLKSTSNHFSSVISYSCFLSEPVPFIQAAVHHFQPNYTAQSGGNVVAPSIIGSNVGNININIFSATQGRNM